MDGNIGPTERRKRLILGVFAVIAGFVLAVAGGVGSFCGWALLFMVFWLGALGLFQAKEKT
ncbi:MAG: hypothetical protein ACREQ7_22495 [Candidatus Binatia bacterium]